MLFHKNFVVQYYLTPEPLILNVKLIGIREVLIKIINYRALSVILKIEKKSLIKQYFTT